MAVRLLSYDVSDLCLGKPPLKQLSAATSTVADALSAINSSSDGHVSIWSCDHSSGNSNSNNCVCVGKICLVDVICYLCEAENLSSRAKALRASVSVILSRVPNLVRHVEPSASLLEAIELMLEGVQNLVVPIKTNSSSRRKPPKATSHNGREYCWLTPEDIIRFLLNSIGLFSTIATQSIDSLGLIYTDYLSITYDSPASVALPGLSHQAPVAVLDSDGSLIGEISPLTLSMCCRETTAAAVATLSAGDLMAYIDCGGPPEDLLRVVESRLRERNIIGFFENFAGSETNSSSEDEEDGFVSSSPKAVLGKPRQARSNSFTARMGRGAEAIFCLKESSLVAVLIQAIAHRVNYVWVVEEGDCGLVGIVTFSSTLGVLYEYLKAMT